MISCVKCHSISTIFLWYKLECLYFMGIYDKWSNFTYLISFKPVFSIGILCLFKITRPPLPSHNAMQFFREVVPQWRIYFIKIRKLIKTHIFIKIQIIKCIKVEIKMELPIYRHFIDNLYMLRNQIKFEYRTYLENTSKQKISCKFDFSELKYHVPRNLSFECLKMKEI